MECENKMNEYKFIAFVKIMSRYSEKAVGRILKYVEDLKRGPNARFGLKDIFEIASKKKAAGLLR